MATLEDVKKAAETATYIDEDGEKKTGTILQTAQAAATGVQTDSKQAATGAGTANPSQTGSVMQGYLNAAEGADYFQTQADLYKGIMELQQKQNRENAELATEGTLEEIARQTEKLETQYGQNDKELYRDYRKDLRDLPQQLAAMGITGGLSETSRVDLESGYGENLNKSQLQRLAAIADLDAQGVAAKRENDATARAQDVAALQAYYNALAQLGGQKYQEDLAKKQQSAETLATMGDFSGYVELGLMTEEQAEQMKKLWIAENPQAAVQMGYVKQSSGGGGHRYYNPASLGASEEEMAALEKWAVDAVGRSSSGRDVESNVNYVAKQVETMRSSGQITNDQANRINSAAATTGVLRNHG